MSEPAAPSQIDELRPEGGADLTLILSSRGAKEEWLDRLRELAEAAALSAPPGQIQIRDEAVEDLPDHPALLLRSSDGREIRYFALPEGPEAKPFQEAIDVMLRITDLEQQQWTQRLDGLRTRCEITVFVAPGCPHCPRAVRAANRLALSNRYVVTTVVDAFELTDLAAKYGVKTAPLTVIDGGLSLPGLISEADLVDHLLERGGEKFLESMFRSLVESGRHGEASRLVSSGEALDPYLRIWKDSTLAVRIGLMLVAEEALERDSRALNPLVPALVEVLESDDASLRGDSIDLLGRIGHPSSVGSIEALRGDSNPHVAEIAAEVAEELTAPGGIQRLEQ